MKYSLSFIVLFLIGSIIGCDEPYPEQFNLENFMFVSLSNSFGEAEVNTLKPEQDTSFIVSAAYGGTTDYNRGQISVGIGVDNSLVNVYNDEYHTAYQALPTEAYSLSKTSLTIDDGKNKSDNLVVTIHSQNLDFSNEYILPVTIKSVSGGNLSAKEDAKTRYFVFRGDIKSEPNTEKWTLHEVSTVWDAIYAIEKVWDGNKDSYWHSEPFDASKNGMPQWFAVNMNDYMFIDGFTWVNRQDAGQDALPKHVIFETSLNGVDWEVVLDVAELPNIRTMQVLELPERVIAKYFKVTILTNWVDAPYTYVAEISTWAGERPVEEYNWEKSTWEVIDFSSDWGGGWSINNIFDDNKNTTWHSEPFDASKNGMPQWFIVDMKKQRPAIKGFLIWNRQDDHGMEPKHVVFSVSNDTETWDVVLDLGEMSNDYSRELDYPTTNSIAAQYLKVEVKTNWGGGAWTYFGEISVY